MTKGRSNKGTAAGSSKEGVARVAVTLRTLFGLDAACFGVLEGSLARLREVVFDIKREDLRRPSSRSTMVEGAVCSELSQETTKTVERARAVDRDFMRLQRQQESVDVNHYLSM